MAFFDSIHALQKKNPPMQQNDMYLRSVDRGKIARYDLSSYFTEKVEWVSLEKDKDGYPLVTREPSETTTEHSRKDIFSLAGKRYPNFRSFLKSRNGEWGEDLYGRKVFCVAELFPCFDSYDYLNENRYYRWYFIREGNTLSRLFVTDTRDKIYVTEDVQNLEANVWEQMKDAGFCQSPESKA